MKRNVIIWKESVYKNDFKFLMYDVEVDEAMQPRLLYESDINTN